jgi:nucleobase:cation symporter-1, NCS1 family
MTDTPAGRSGPGSAGDRGGHSGLGATGDRGGHGGPSSAGCPSSAGDPGRPGGAGDRAGHIETHGIDYIPVSERHGRPRSLFVVWAASNVTYLYIVLGGAMILLGLNVWQSLAVVVAGNLFWPLVGWLSISGPSAGTPSEVITRAMFGVRGNRVFNVVLGWGVGVAYEAINLSLGALAGFTLVTQCGGHAGTAVKLAVVLATALVTFAISVYGHATIVKLSGWFTWLLLACIAVLGYDVLRHAHWGYQTPAAYAVHGGALWGIAAAGFTIIASSPLSWGTGADYARYLPADTSVGGVIGWTTLGGFLPSVLLGGLGVLAGTVVDMANPQTSLAALLPGWFYPIFLLVIVVGSITNNVLTAYSTGLALLAVGIPWKRSVTVIFDAVVAIGITGYALFISDFLSTLNNILALTVAFLGPALAIYGIDILLRGNRYQAAELHDESPGSRFWYWRGVNPAGATAMIVGTGAALLCVNSAIYVGPVARLLDGADLSSLVGTVLGAGVYAALATGRFAVRRRRGAVPASAVAVAAAVTAD